MPCPCTGPDAAERWHLERVGDCERVRGVQVRAGLQDSREAQRAARRRRAQRQLCTRCRQGASCRRERPCLGAQPEEEEHSQHDDLLWAQSGGRFLGSWIAHVTASSACLSPVLS
jgi:hypothetical protein